MVALCDLELDRLDVKIAILHSKLEEHIYMPQEGFMISSKELDHVFLLCFSAFSFLSPTSW